MDDVPPILTGFMSPELGEERMLQTTNYFICKLHRDPEYQMLCASLKTDKPKYSPWSYLAWVTMMACAILAGIHIHQYYGAVWPVTTFTIRGVSTKGEVVPAVELDVRAVHVRPQTALPHADSDAGMFGQPAAGLSPAPPPSQQVLNAVPSAVTSPVPASVKSELSSALQPLTEPHVQHSSGDSMKQLAALMPPESATPGQVQPQQQAPSSPLSAFEPVQAVSTEQEPEARLGQAEQALLPSVLANQTAEPLSRREASLLSLTAVMGLGAQPGARSRGPSFGSAGQVDTAAPPAYEPEVTPEAYAEFKNSASAVDATEPLVIAETASLEAVAVEVTGAATSSELNQPDVDVAPRAEPRAQNGGTAAVVPAKANLVIDIIRKAGRVVLALLLAFVLLALWVSVQMAEAVTFIDDSGAAETCIPEAGAAAKSEDTCHTTVDTVAAGATEEHALVAPPCRVSSRGALSGEFDIDLKEALRPPVVSSDSGEWLQPGDCDQPAAAAHDAYFSSDSMEGFPAEAREVPSPLFHACLMDAATSHAKPPGVDASLDRFGSPPPMAVDMLTPPEPPSPFPGFPPLIGELSLQQQPDTDVDMKVASAGKSVSWGSSPEASGQGPNWQGLAEGQEPGSFAAVAGDEPASPEATPWPFTYPSSSGEQSRGAAETPTESTGSSGPSGGTVSALMLPVAEGEKVDATIFDLSNFNDDGEVLAPLAPPSPWAVRVSQHRDDTRGATAGDAIQDYAVSPRSVTSVAGCGQEQPAASWRMAKAKPAPGRVSPRASDVQPSDILSAMDSTGSADVGMDDGPAVVIAAEAAAEERSTSTPMWPPKAVQGGKVAAQTLEDEAHALIAAEALSLADSLVCNSATSTPAASGLSLGDPANYYVDPGSASSGQVPELKGPIGDPWSAIAGHARGDHGAATDAVEGMLQRRHEPGRDYAATAAATHVLFTAIKEQSRNISLAAASGDKVQLESAQRELHAAISQLVEMDLAPNAHTALTRACKTLVFSAAATPVNQAAAPSFSYSSGGGVSWASIGSRVVSGGGDSPSCEAHSAEVHPHGVCPDANGGAAGSPDASGPAQLSYTAAHVFSGEGTSAVMVAGLSRIPRASSAPGAKATVCSHSSSRIPPAVQPSGGERQERPKANASLDGAPATPSSEDASSPAWTEPDAMAAGSPNSGRAEITPDLTPQGRLPTPASEAPVSAASRDRADWPEGPAPLPANIDAYLEARSANKSPLEFVLNGFQGTVAYQGLLIAAMANDIRDLAAELASWRSRAEAATRAVVDGEGGGAHRLDDVTDRKPDSPSCRSRQPLLDEDVEDVTEMGFYTDSDVVDVSPEDSELSFDGLRLPQLLTAPKEFVRDMEAGKGNDSTVPAPFAEAVPAPAAASVEEQDSGDAAWVCVEASSCEASAGSAQAVAGLDGGEEEQVASAPPEEDAAVALLSLRQDADTLGPVAWTPQEVDAPSPARSEVSKIVERVLNRAKQLSTSNVMKIYAPQSGSSGAGSDSETTRDEAGKVVVKAVDRDTDPVVTELVRRQFSRLRASMLEAHTPASSAGSCGGGEDTFGRCGQDWCELGSEAGSCTGLWDIHMQLQAEAANMA